MGLGEAGDPVGCGGERDAVALSGRVDSQSDGQVGFACAGWAEQHDVAGLGEERAGGQRGDLVADGGLDVKVEVVEGLAAWKPGGFDA